MNFKPYLTFDNILRFIMLLGFYSIADSSANVIIPYIEPLANLLDAYNAGTLPESQANLVYAALSFVSFFFSISFMYAILFDWFKDPLYRFFDSIVPYVRRTFFKNKEVK